MTRRKVTFGKVYDDFEYGGAVAKVDVYIDGERSDWYLSEAPGFFRTRAYELLHRDEAFMEAMTVVPGTWESLNDAKAGTREYLE